MMMLRCSREIDQQKKELIKELLQKYMLFYRKHLRQGEMHLVTAS
jgi:hypothetical protein